MNSRIIVGVAAAIATVSSLFLTSTAARAGETRIYCGSDGYNPATIIDAPGYNPFPLIVWNQAPGVDFGPEYTPQVRCNIVSNKAQDYWNRGILHSFTTGTHNSYPVICVAATSGGPCSGLLFTLRLNANPTQTLNELFSAYQTSNAIYQSDGRTYVDLQDILDNSVAATAIDTAPPILDPTPEEPSTNVTPSLCPGPLCQSPQ